MERRCFIYARRRPRCSPAFPLLQLLLLALQSFPSPIRCAAPPVRLQRRTPTSEPKIHKRVLVAKEEVLYIPRQAEVIFNPPVNIRARPTPERIFSPTGGLPLEANIVASITVDPTPGPTAGSPPPSTAAQKTATPTNGLREAVTNLPMANIATNVRRDSTSGRNSFPTAKPMTHVTAPTGELRIDKIAKCVMDFFGVTGAGDFYTWRKYTENFIKIHIDPALICSGVDIEITEKGTMMQFTVFISYHKARTKFLEEDDFEVEIALRDLFQDKSLSALYLFGLESADPGGPLSSAIGLQVGIPNQQILAFEDFFVVVPSTEDSYPENDTILIAGSIAAGIVVLMAGTAFFMLRIFGGDKAKRCSNNDKSDRERRKDSTRRAESESESESDSEDESHRKAEKSASKGKHKRKHKRKRYDEKVSERKKKKSNRKRSKKNRSSKSSKSSNSENKRKDKSSKRKKISKKETQNLKNSNDERDGNRPSKKGKRKSTRDSRSSSHNVTVSESESEDNCSESESDSEDNGSESESDSEDNTERRGRRNQMPVNDRMVPNININVFYDTANDSDESSVKNVAQNPSQAEMLKFLSNSPNYMSQSIRGSQSSNRFSSRYSNSPSITDISGYPRTGQTHNRRFSMDHIHSSNQTTGGNLRRHHSMDQSQFCNRTMGHSQSNRKSEMYQRRKSYSDLAFDCNESVGNSVGSSVSEMSDLTLTSYTLDC